MLVRVKNDPVASEDFPQAQATAAVALQSLPLGVSYAAYRGLV